MKDKKNFRIFPVCICILLCLLLFISPLDTFALLRTQKEKINHLALADTRTTLVDEFDPPDEVEEGEEVSKKVAVTNDSGLPVFVRIMAHPQVTGNDKSHILQTSEITFTDIDYSSWKDGRDGYYYYLKPLAPGETTETLFTKLIVNNDIGSEYFVGGSVDIAVVSESCAIAEDNYHYQVFWGGSAPAAGSDLADIEDIFQEIIRDLYKTEGGG